MATGPPGLTLSCKGIRLLIHPGNGKAESKTLAAAGVALLNCESMARHGTIAITDYNWYASLSQRRSWDEVNFWKPTTTQRFRAPEFSPFFFKLKAPYRAIAGFGYFARYSELPEWLAWDCFGPANGSDSFEEMHTRLQKIRTKIKAAPQPGILQIGCIVVVNATFFSQDEWVPQPRDWADSNLRHTVYDSDVGEGARVWSECVARIQSTRDLRVAEGTKDDQMPRYGSPILVHPRLGQGAFRVSVTEAYDRACAVTREHSLPALEAAHIRPFAKEGPHEVRNGLLLRADLHRLFEQGYMTVTPDYVLNVSDRLRDDYHNGRSYYPLGGTRISTPTLEAEQPMRDLLEWHNQNVFLR